MAIPPYDKPDRVVRFGGTAAAPTTGEYTEPPSGKKDIGWILGDEPPSSYWNWLCYQAYKWFRWLDERMADVTTKANFRIFAPAPETSSLNGGDLELVGGASGADADKNGGDAAVSGGQSTGNGSSVVFVKAATKGASGATVRTPETYLKADGNDEYSTALKPLLVNADPASGSLGAALVAQASADGYALGVVGDAGSPVKAGARLTPQNADPSSPDNGAIYTNSVTDQLSHYSAVLARFQALDTLVYQKPGEITETDTDTSEHLFNDGADVKYTIPANTLRAGSVVKIRAWGFHNYVAGGPVTITVSVRVGGSLVARESYAISADRHWRIEAEALIKTIGASGVACVGGFASSDNTTGSDPNTETYNQQVSSFDTTGTNDVDARYQFGASGNNNETTLRGFTVEVL